MERILLILVILTSQLAGLGAQQVWPGDVNNNGIVNHVDVLYWALARTTEGPARPDASSDWAGQDLPELWEESFPDGLNYAYADCNGDGSVDDDDREVITDNFLRERTNSTPDDFQTGEPSVSPLLEFTADEDDDELEPEESIEVTISLLPGATGSIDNFFGLAFVIPYDRDNLENRGNERPAFALERDDDIWAGSVPNQVQEFNFNDSNTGRSYVAIYRKGSPVSSEEAGELGQYIVVVGDIVFVNSLEFNPEQIKLVDPELKETAVAPIGVTVPEGKTTPTIELNEDASLHLYPNPAKEWVNIEIRGTNAQIERVEVFNLLGQPLEVIRNDGRSKLQVHLGHYAKGMYVLRVHTSNGIVTRTISR